MRQIPFGQPLIGAEEKRAVMEVLEGHILTHGPKVREFEEAFCEYLGGGTCLAIASCTAGLHLYYFSLGIGPGDEVIVPAQTHTATAHAVEFCGATPVFVDSEMDTGNLDLDLLEKKISDRTKAISIVHFLGMPVDMRRVRGIAEEKNLPVVEDCALAIGTYYDGKHAGLHGDVGCFSFYPVKHITTGEGGMVVTKHDRVAEMIKKQRAFGIDRDISERKVPGVYDVETLGFNYRMSELQAALGVEQLRRIDGFLKKREENYQRLEHALKTMDGLRLFRSSGDHFESSYYCLSVVLDENTRDRRFEIVKGLNERGVGTSVYYPRPVPLMSYYRNKYGFTAEDFPRASEISNCSIALPVGPHLGLDDMDYMVEALRDTMEEVRE